MIPSLGEYIRRVARGTQCGCGGIYCGIGIGDQGLDGGVILHRFGVGDVEFLMIQEGWSEYCRVAYRSDWEWNTIANGASRRE